MTARRIIVLACVVVGLLALFALAGDVRESARHLAAYDLRYFVLGLALTSTNYVVRFARWQRYLALVSATVPWRESARIFVSGFVMSISPGKMGEVLKSALLKELHDIPAERTAPIVLAERLTDLLALVILVSLSGFAEPDALPIALAALLLVFCVLAPLLSPRVAEALLGILGRLPRLSRLAPKLLDAYASTRRLLSGRALLMGTAFAVVGWSLECVATFTIVRGFHGAGLSLIDATFGYAAPTILGALTFLPGGLVATEASMTSLFVRMGHGITPGIAAGTTLLVRLATLWWGVGLGWVALALHERAVAIRKRPEEGTA